ncbi:MAG: hypothetical protein N2116_02355, partial [Armatimonadetes bacterium]|nr:hypothetical protein [Armatimonadota bacterium]
MLRLKRFLAEKEVLISVVIFGVLVMLADIFSDLNWQGFSVALRVLGVLSLIGLFILDIWFR